MNSIKSVVLVAAITLGICVPASAIELTGTMTITPKVITQVPWFDDDGNPVLDPDTGVQLTTREVTGSYFTMGGPIGGKALVSGPDGGLIIGTYQNFILDPDEPHPAGHPLAIYGAGSGFSGTPTQESGMTEPFGFFGQNTYVGTNPLAYQSGNSKPVPSVEVDAEGNLTVELSAWEVMWAGTAFEQGPRLVAEDFDWSPVPPELWPPSAPATGFIPAQGTYDFETAHYILMWDALIVGGPFGGIIGHWRLEGLILAEPVMASTLAEPESVNVKSQGSSFTVTIDLQDTDGTILPGADIHEGVMISSVGDVKISSGEISENVAGRIVVGDTLQVVFDDPDTGNRQDIISAIAGVADKSMVDVCVTGMTRDANGVLRPFEGCSPVKVLNKGNR